MKTRVHQSRTPDLLRTLHASPQDGRWSSYTWKKKRRKRQNENLTRSSPGCLLKASRFVKLSYLFWRACLFNSTIRNEKGEKKKTPTRINGNLPGCKLPSAWSSGAGFPSRADLAFQTTSPLPAKKHGTYTMNKYHNKKFVSSFRYGAVRLTIWSNHIGTLCWMWTRYVPPLGPPSWTMFASRSYVVDFCLALASGVISSPKSTPLMGKLTIVGFFSTKNVFFVNRCTPTETRHNYTLENWTSKTKKDDAGEIMDYGRADEKL